MTHHIDLEFESIPLSFGMCGLDVGLDVGLDLDLILDLDLDLHRDLDLDLDLDLCLGLDLGLDLGILSLAGRIGTGSLARRSGHTESGRTNS